MIRRRSIRKDGDPPSTTWPRRVGRALGRVLRPERSEDELGSSEGFTPRTDPPRDWRRRPDVEDTDRS